MADEIEAMIQLLPACKRCRAVKKRCDVLLPACANCTKAGMQCIFYDSVSKELLPREYIHSMIEHLRSLEADRDRRTKRSSASPSRSPSTTTDSAARSLIPVRSSFQFVGGNAPILAAVDLSAYPRQSQPHLARIYPSLYIPSNAYIDDDLHEFLLDRYCTSIGVVYPVFDDQTLRSLGSLARTRNSAAGQAFLLKMIYSIACHCLQGNDTRLTHLSDALYQEAWPQIESLMKDHRIEALQAMVLLTVRSHFDPASGSIGQLVNFAHRLEVELSSHSIPEIAPVLQRLQCTIYCLGGLASGTLDRPYDIVHPGPAALQTTAEAQILCSVYEWQTRWRAGEESISSPVSNPSHLERLDHPQHVLALVRQTQLLIKPSAESAQQLLAVYDDESVIYNVFSSHWIYRAASYLMENTDADTATQASVVAVKTLERCASKWPSARGLQRGLDSLRRKRVNSCSVFNSQS